MSGTKTHGQSELVGFHVDGDELLGQGGFLTLRRLRLRNQRADGTLSAPFVCDFVVRPKGADAVVVAVYRWETDGPWVLLREGMRPPLWFGRGEGEIPVADPRTYLRLREAVAGIIERHDVGEAGIRQRAADEVLEEAGARVAPAELHRLGPPSFPSPGAMVEKLHFFAAQVSSGPDELPGGDGSPMEESALLFWQPLADALADCENGVVEDLKTEIVLRRLERFLSAMPNPSR